MWLEKTSGGKSALKLDHCPNPLAEKKLSKMEKIVLGLIIAGKSNKEIARTLYRSIRTVEDHRSRIMHKLKVDNVVNLVKLVIANKTSLD